MAQPQLIQIEYKQNMAATFVSTLVAILVAVPIAMMVALNVAQSQKASADPVTQTAQVQPVSAVQASPACVAPASEDDDEVAAASYGGDVEQNAHVNGWGDTSAWHGAVASNTYINQENTETNINTWYENSFNTAIGSFNEDSFNEDSYNETETDVEIDVEVDINSNNGNNSNNNSNNTTNTTTNNTTNTTTNTTNTTTSNSNNTVASNNNTNVASNNTVDSNNQDNDTQVLVGALQAAIQD